MLSAYIVPVFMLSVFPHQEPRFIIPILLPIVFLFTNTIKNVASDTIDIHKIKKNLPSAENKKSRINMLNLWYFSNIILTLFYGFVHQGGVLPLTTHLSSELKSKPDLTHIYYVSSHTYPLPTALLHLRNSKKTYKSDSGNSYKFVKDFHVYELGSQNAENVFKKIFDILQDSEKNSRLKKIPYRFYYVLPFSFYYEFSEYTWNNETHPFRFNILKSFYPHMSMEKVPEFNLLWTCFKSIAINECFDSILSIFDTSKLNYLKQFTLVLLRIELSSPS